MEYIQGLLLSVVTEEKIDFYRSGKLLKGIYGIKGDGFGSIKKFYKVSHYMTFEEYVKKQFMDEKLYNENELEKHCFLSYRFFHTQCY